MRPTLRCLRQDPGSPVPAAHVPLDQVEHPLLCKVAGRFADPATSRERIRAIDDGILFKVRVGRYELYDMS
ncbi:hypothetical protein [Actinoallomurus sp. CA-150999]|uniref:hypothetical protein n=1 Tax=Actinoallomurus sp. CA-150999 TaxID=3239887 RepID=UPI003D8A30EF